jgi:hypothetical protein
VCPGAGGKQDEESGAPRCQADKKRAAASAPVILQVQAKILGRPRGHKKGAAFRPRPEKDAGSFSAACYFSGT